MPTKRPRHVVTESDEIAAALDEAQRRWPNEPRSRLVARVLLDWHRSRPTPEQRRAAMDRLIGSMPGTSRLYNRDDEWPE